MDLEGKMNQEMTLYRVSGYDGGGIPIVSSIELIKTRDAGTEEIMPTNPGGEIYKRILIMSEAVFEEGDLIVKGNTVDITDPVEANANEVKRITVIPSLRSEYNLNIYHV